MKHPIRTYVLLQFALLALMLVLFAGAVQAQTRMAGVPPDAHRYEATLKRNAQMLWGLSAPVASFAAQIHQESRWRADAKSPVGAVGLAQFMPATTQWIGGMQTELSTRAATNPTWALRALVVYDKWLADRIKAVNPCERMAFALSAYNGGLGWVYKRQARSAEPGVCFGATCNINPGVTPASQRENARYPDVILHQHQPLYRLWGPGACT